MQTITLGDVILSYSGDGPDSRDGVQFFEKVQWPRAQPSPTGLPQEDEMISLELCETVSLDDLRECAIVGCFVVGREVRLGLLDLEAQQSFLVPVPWHERFVKTGTYDPSRCAEAMLHIFGELKITDSETLIESDLTSSSNSSSPESGSDQGCDDLCNYMRPADQPAQPQPARRAKARGSFAVADGAVRTSTRKKRPVVRALDTESNSASSTQTNVKRRRPSEKRPMRARAASRKCRSSTPSTADDCPLAIVPSTLQANTTRSDTVTQGEEGSGPPHFAGISSGGQVSARTKLEDRVRELEAELAAVRRGEGHHDTSDPLRLAPAQAYSTSTIPAALAAYHGLLGSPPGPCNPNQPFILPAAPPPSRACDPGSVAGFLQHQTQAAMIFGFMGWMR